MTRTARWQLVVSIVSACTAAASGAAAQHQVTTRVSVDGSGNQVIGTSRHPSVSADGRFIAFSSTADTLVPGDGNASADVFVKDRQTGAVTRVSVRSDGSQQTGDSVAPDISSDGRYVTFASSAALVADDTNTCVGTAPTCTDVYVHDRTTGATARVSVGTGGAQGNAISQAPRIAGGGRYIAFESAATTLVDGDSNGVIDVFLRDTVDATTTRVSVATGGAQSDRPARAPTITDDGASIAFVSDATTLDATADTLPCAPAIMPCGRAFVRTVGHGTRRVGLTPRPNEFVPVIAQAYWVTEAAISGDGSTVAAIVVGRTTEGPLVGGADTLATYSLGTGDTRGELTFYGTPPQPAAPTWPTPSGPSRYTSLAINRTGRIVASCYFGFSAAGNTYGVIIRDVMLRIGTTAAGTTDPGGYLAAQPDCEGVALSDDGLATALASSGAQIVSSDTNGAMDVFVQHRDTDGDGLPSEWEATFSLPSNVADSTADPDADGMTNAEEFAAGTHPRGSFRYHLAEGAANAFFFTEIAILNPGRRVSNADGGFATTLLQFFGQNGRRTTSSVWTVYARDDGGYAKLSWSSVAQPDVPPDQAFSTLVESDRPLAVDRTVSWGGPIGVGYGSHAETASTGPATTALFAEGATHGPFDLFYLLHNPANLPATATITYLRPAPLAPVVRSYALLPNSRRTIHVDVEPGLEATDVSATIAADRPIFAERAMYLSAPGQPFAGGTASAGITAAATQWFIAEGATGAFFDLYILIGNPSSTAASVAVRYLLPDGTSIDKTHHVAAESRLTIPVKSEDPRLAATAVSASITSTNATPIVVERAMWWPSPSWYEGTVTSAARAAATRWALAGGYLDRRGADTETYLLVANPGDTDAQVTFDLGLDGASARIQRPTWQACRVTVTVPARSRYTTGLRGVCPFENAPPLDPLRIGGTIESDGPPIVVERSTYWSAGGQFWAAGASTLLTPLP